MPAAKPIVLYGPNGKTLRWSGNDRMIDASRQRYDRPRVDCLDRDFHANLSPYGRRQLLTLGRKAYFKSHAVRGAVEDMATHAAGHYLFESRSADPAFKSAAEQLLYTHDRTADIAGSPWNNRSYLKSLARAPFIDGDIGTLYVQGDDGLPYFQVVPSHRIASAEDKFSGGKLDGARILDGVIVDGLNRPLAYRVLTGDPGDDKSFVDVPAMSLSLAFLPLMPGQVRGLSILGLAWLTLSDISDSDRYELMAQRHGAQRVFAEHNESGEPEPGSDSIQAPADNANMYREVIEDGVINSYFKTVPGAGLEAVKFDRPSANQMNFKAQQWREVLAGSKLSVDFHLDLSKLGGAALRLLVAKVNANHADLQREILEPCCRRFDFFRLASFIASGRLPAAADWYNFEYTAGAKLTPDAKYDSDVLAQNLRIGIDTRARATACLGECLEDVRAANESALDDLLTRAARVQARHPAIPLDIILARLENDTQQAPAVVIDRGEPSPAASGNQNPGDQ